MQVLADSNLTFAKATRVRGSKAADGKQVGEAFYDALRNAKASAHAEYGNRWFLVSGASQLITIPARLASFKGPLGTTIKMRRDLRVPAVRYWQDGVFPDGVSVTLECAPDPEKVRYARMMEARCAYLASLRNGLSTLYGRDEFCHKTDERKDNIRTAWQNRKAYLTLVNPAAPVVANDDTPAVPEYTSWHGSFGVAA